MPTCIFDRIRDGEVPGHLVADEPDLLAFLDSRPVFAGHTLIIPRAHIATLAELTDEQAASIWALGRRLAAAMRPAVGAEGAFLALNDEISQSVPHVHLHVIPRRRKDGLRGFLWPRTRYTDDAHAAAVAAALRRALEDTHG
ncbi:MAG: HIT family protein [Acidimicrobiales bacterium]